MKPMRERLIELIDEKQVYGIDQYQPESHNTYLLDNDELADHLLANGVIVPPVKIGQTVYIIGWCGDIEEFVVRDVRLVTNAKGDCSYSFRAVIGEDGDIHFMDYYIGVTVFLTREQAEKALKEAEG